MKEERAKEYTLVNVEAIAAQKAAEANAIAAKREHDLAVKAEKKAKGAAFLVAKKSQTDGLKKPLVPAESLVEQVSSEQPAAIAKESEVQAPAESPEGPKAQL